MEGINNTFEDLSGRGQQDAPELARFEMKLFQYRIGKMFDPSDGSFVGIIIQVFMPAIPWLKIHLPFMRLDARKFVTTITGVLDEEIETESETTS